MWGEAEREACPGQAKAVVTPPSSPPPPSPPPLLLFGESSDCHEKSSKPAQWSHATEMMEMRKGRASELLVCSPSRERDQVLSVDQCAVGETHPEEGPEGEGNGVGMNGT